MYIIYCVSVRLWRGDKSKIMSTRDNGRAGKMWSCREWVGTRTEIPSVFRSRPRLPDPFPTLVSVSTVFCPDLRHLVPVPTVARPALKGVFQTFPPFRRPPSCSHSIPTFEHIYSHPITHYNSGRFFPSHFHRLCIHFPHHMTTDSYRHNFSCSTLLIYCDNSLVYSVAQQAVI